MTLEKLYTETGLIKDNTEIIRTPEPAQKIPQPAASQPAPPASTSTGNKESNIKTSPSQTEKTASASNAVEALKARGTFVLGLDDSFPPLGYRDDNNEIVGYDIDLAKEVAKRLGVEFKAQPIDWDAKEMELETGKIDCIWNGFTITEERIVS
mgnify:CR=1 FL=1